MHKPTIIIIEDEVLIAESTASILQELNYLVCDMAHTLEDALTLIKKADYSIALVDINLGEGTEGIEIGRELDRLNKPYIYLTSYADKKTLEQVKETRPSAYIVKPASKKDLFTNIELVLSRSTMLPEEKMTKIRIQDGKETFFVAPNDIRWLKADKNYVEIKTSAKRIVCRNSLSKLLGEIPLKDMIQIHRSWAVNVKYIDKITTCHVIIDKLEIPYSGTYKKHLMNKLQNS